MKPGSDFTPDQKQKLHKLNSDFSDIAAEAGMDKNRLLVMQSYIEDAISTGNKVTMSKSIDTLANFVTDQRARLDDNTLNNLANNLAEMKTEAGIIQPILERKASTKLSILPADDQTPTVTQKQKPDLPSKTGVPKDLNINTRPPLEGGHANLKPVNAELNRKPNNGVKDTGSPLTEYNTQGNTIIRREYFPIIINAQDAISAGNVKALKKILDENKILRDNLDQPFLNGKKLVEFAKHDPIKKLLQKYETKIGSPEQPKKGGKFADRIRNAFRKQNHQGRS